MSCSVRGGLAMVFCFILLLLSFNVGCATARRIGSHKHHHHRVVASLVHNVVNGGGRRRVLGGGVETGDEVVVMDYPQPHRKPPIHNEKS
ncbi:PREDICTED: root meristem growth factor 6-like [Camelina sativa]|uniref:Root meristem growth factor 6-like n=1 Tax=Camelina sativa TaxID=90675 RepID=A0ABM1QSQ2_CAMSA|nr:PREDICTED: root meristem growth factor 6-like [Camelina sativa]XP_019089790.1 PREDICTED: root meristem growth factor 6-like [Camelina sativa]